LEPGTQIGPYQIVGRIGSGGMGEVYRAQDTVLDREVAIKTLPPDMRGNKARLERFEREAKLLASLNHPNIATLHGLEKVGEERFLIMELVAGDPLDRLLDLGPLAVGDALRIGRQIADALEAAHEKGIVHRDLKPSNVIVGPRRQRVKVLDFGVAKSIEPRGTASAPEARDLTGLTAPGAILGTPPYMSPEQVRGQAIDDRSDVWAFGCLLYEMLTGRRAYQGESFADTLSAILTRVPDWQRLPPEVPEGVRSLLERCFVVDRNLRVSMADVRDRLDDILENRPASVSFPALPSLPTLSPPTWVDMPRPNPSSAPVVSAAAGVPFGTDSPTLSTSPTLASPARRRSLIAVAAVLAVALGAGGAVLLPRLRDSGGESAQGGASEIRSLVVLPSQVLGEESDRFLADAIPNTVSTHLAQVEGLETKVPPSNVEFERIGRDLNAIAESYHVNGVVLPTITVVADQLTLNLQLVAVPSRVVLWTRDFEGRRDRYVELARGAAEGIRQALRPTAPALPRAADVVRDSEAELALHQGLFLANLFRRQGLPEDFERAEAALRRALELDPRQAEAAAELARLHAARIVTGVPPQEIVPEVRAWARRALEIDPRSSRAWAVLSEVEQIDPQGNYRRMLETGLKAATFGSDDGYAHMRLSSALSLRSVLLGLEALQRARQLDPLELSSPLLEALTLMVIDRVDEARERVEQVRRVEPDMPFAILVHTLVEIVDGRVEAAAELVAQLEPMASDGRIRPEWLEFVRDFVEFQRAAEQGNQALEDAAAARLIRVARGERKFPRWEKATSEVAPLLARQGRAREALDLMLYRQEIGVLENYEFLLLNKDLEPLRGDARFRRLLDPLRKDFDEMLVILAAARKRGEFPAYLDPAVDKLLPLVGVPRPW
jgi:serine/threonine protein kinase/Flp pilus assembly protein TadD